MSSRPTLKLGPNPSISREVNSILPSTSKTRITKQTPTQTNSKKRRTGVNDPSDFASSKRFPSQVYSAASQPKKLDNPFGLVEYISKGLKRLFLSSKTTNTPNRAPTCVPLLLNKFKQLSRLTIGKKAADQAKCLVKAMYTKVDSQMICLKLCLDLQVPKDAGRFTRVTLIAAFRDGQQAIIPIEDHPIVKEPLTMDVSHERTQGGELSLTVPMTGPAGGAKYSMQTKHVYNMKGIPVIEVSHQFDEDEGIRWILEEAQDATFGVRYPWMLPIHMKPTLPLYAEFRLECSFTKFKFFDFTYSVPIKSDEPFVFLNLSLIEQGENGDEGQHHFKREYQCEVEQEDKQDGEEDHPEDEQEDEHEGEQEEGEQEDPDEDYELGIEDVYD